MILLSKLALLGIVLVLTVPTGAAPASHYDPVAHDGFHYYETTVLNDGAGNYAGYVNRTWTNGTENVTAVAPNGTDSATFSWTEHYSDNAGYHGTLPDSGTFTFSAATYTYVHGTDGPSGPHVWFYINNTLPVGGQFHLNSTEFNVTSVNTSYPIAFTSTGYAATISGYGHGSYTYLNYTGVSFTGRYTWTAYFDPHTGYIVGYAYQEQDRDASGDGYTWTDDLSVTHTSYRLTPYPAPSSGGPGSPFGSSTVLLVIVAIVVVVVIVVAALALRARRPSLPRHSPTGRVDYTPIPPLASAPPVGLSPGAQPAVQQIVMRETVKVNCRYCGTLIDTTATVCPNCGAPRA
ncbi:MAG: zinc ribbon domain-containing protein [Thermoplasmata archaeon]